MLLNLGLTDVATASRLRKFKVTDMLQKSQKGLVVVADYLLLE